MTNEQYINRRAARFLETTKVSTDLQYHFAQRWGCIAALMDPATRKSMRAIDELLDKLSHQHQYAVRPLLGGEL